MQEEVDIFVGAFKDAGFGWTYYKWSASKTTDGDHLGNVLYESFRTPKTIYLEYLVNAIQEFY